MRKLLLEVVVVVLVQVVMVAAYGVAVGGVPFSDVVRPTYDMLLSIAPLLTSPSLPYPIIVIHLLYCGVKICMERRHRRSGYQEYLQQVQDLRAVQYQQYPQLIQYLQPIQYQWPVQYLQPYQGYPCTWVPVDQYPCQSTTTPADGLQD